MKRRAVIGNNVYDIINITIAILTLVAIVMRALGVYVFIAKRRE